MNWTPAKSEPDLLEAAINDLARHTLMPAVVPAVGSLDPEGWRKVTLADGRQAAITLEIRPSTDRQWGPRAAACYDFVGQAALERDGFAIAGAIIVDVATKAFLEVDCELTATGRIEESASSS